MFIFKHFVKINNKNFPENKRENTVYNIFVKYAFKSFGQLFVGYLRHT